MALKELQRGIDISHHDNDRSRLDFLAMKNDGVKFVFIKCGEWTDFTDPWFYRNWDAARAAHIHTAPYFWLRGSVDWTKAGRVWTKRKLPNTGAAQARYCYRILTQLQGGVPKLVAIDFETTGRALIGGSPDYATLAAFVDEFRRLVPYVSLVLYTSGVMWRAHARNHDARELRLLLWTANYPGGYGNVRAKFNVNYGGWTRAEVVQYASGSSVNGWRTGGGRHDANAFLGGLSSLASLFAGVHSTPNPDPDPVPTPSPIPDPGLPGGPQDEPWYNPVNGFSPQGEQAFAAGLGGGAFMVALAAIAVVVIAVAYKQSKHTEHVLPHLREEHA